MSKSVPFMVVTNEKISKGDLITIEGDKFNITSIYSVEPFVGDNYRVIGRCKENIIDKWETVIQDS